MRTAMALAALLAASGPAWAGGGGKIKWRTHKGYEAAIKEAKESGKPVMLYFTADF